MILLDTNILLYAYDEACPQYPAVNSWMAANVSEHGVFGFPWTSVWGFLRISTNPRGAARPISLPRAFEVVRQWLALPGATVIHPGPRHAEILERLAISGQASGPLITDAVLAALAVEYGATLASTDRDFSRFPGLRWVNPLEEPRR